MSFDASRAKAIFLEVLEHRLSTRDTITVELASPPAYRGTGDPGYLWYRNNFKRLQQLHEKFDDASGFPLLDEFYVHALHGPGTYKSRMCSMTLFVYASLLVSLADRTRSRSDSAAASWLRAEASEASASS